MSIVKMMEAVEAETPTLTFKQYVKKRGMTLRSVMLDVGLSPSFYRLLQRGGKPQSVTIKKLADYFQIPENEVRALFTPKPEVAEDLGRPVYRQFRTLPQDVTSQPDEGKLSVTLSTLADGQAHLVLHLDRVMPLAEALTLLRCLSGG